MLAAQVAKSPPLYREVTHETLVDRSDRGAPDGGSGVLGFEAAYDLFGIHAQLDDLECDPAKDGGRLLGEVRDAPA